MKQGMTGRWTLAVGLALGLARGGLATETEHTDFRILPAPGRVVIDGKFDDWDLSGSMLICSDVENYRDQYASWQSAMYDADNLYLLSRWIDTTPMNNPGVCGSDMGWGGDCLQLRLITSGSGMPDAKSQDDAAGQRTTHVTAWRGRDGRDIIELAYGKKFNEGGVKDAGKEGARQAFLADADGKGYVQEIAIPWRLLTRDGTLPKAGDTLVMTYEPNFGTSSKMRISTKDLFRPGVTPDRVFAFHAHDRWGLAKLEPAGRLAPLPVRLSDGRTFPVTMAEGRPVVDWSGLYVEDKAEGFVKIGLQLPEDGFVSLVIRNADGMVVCHLLNAKFMTRGPQEVLWDGLTTPSSRRPGDPVPAGAYTWEAIIHKGLDLSLVGWACNSGRAPFDSPGGNWGGDQGSPCAVDSDGGSVFLGWGGSEAGKALVCTDLDGKVKWRHKRGGFGGAQLIAADKGFVLVYDAGQDNTLYRLDATKGEYANWQGADEALLSMTDVLAPYRPAGVTNRPAASGMAALGGALVISYGGLAAPWDCEQPSGDVLVVLDAATGKLQKTIKVRDPGDLKVGADGRLYLVCGAASVCRVDLDAGTVAPVVSGLKGVRSVAADAQGNVYAGLGDPDNQVAVFDGKGQRLRTIGKAGGRPLLGLWDKAGMRFVAGLKVDARGKLWVMERDDMPRRISVWDAATGAFDREFFGPTDYGAVGGAICPTDPYTMIGHGCEWKLAPETGKAECVAVFHRGRWQNARFGFGKDGRIYAAVGGGWHGFHPVCIYERIAAGDWKLRTKLLPMAADEKHYSGETVKEGKLAGIAVWADANGDQAEQPGERKAYPMDLGGWIDGWYMCCNQALTFSGGRYRLDVAGWTACGAPQYDPSTAARLPAPEDLLARGGMGAQRGLVSEGGDFVIYNGHYGAEYSDFPCYDTKTGRKVFAYPNNYVGVHGGHLAPPARTGLIRGAYDFVGTVKQPAPLNNLFIIGTDKGEWHVLSSSGFYLASLFQGDPMKIKWPDEAVPGANMNTVPPGMGAEDFGGSVALATNGTLYLQAGKTAFINCKVSGLDTVRALGAGSITMSADDMAQAQQFKVKYLSGTERPKRLVVQRRTVAFSGDPGRDFGTTPVVYGADRSSVRTWLACDEAMLYAAWLVSDATPWVNGATGFENLYACGDTVDLQLGTDPAADTKRREAGPGDLRLSIGALQGKPTAVLYRKVAADKAPRTFYSGVWKDGYTMEFVKAMDKAHVQVKVTQGKAYVVEAGIPLADLGLAPKPGLTLRGDVGATFGDPEGKDTSLRVYWSNQATGIVADEVEELKLQPALWGEWRFE